MPSSQVPWYLGHLAPNPLASWLCQEPSPWPPWCPWCHEIPEMRYIYHEEWSSSTHQCIKNRFPVLTHSRTERDNQNPLFRLLFEVLMWGYDLRKVSAWIHSSLIHFNLPPYRCHHSLHHLFLPVDQLLGSSWYHHLLDSLHIPPPSLQHSQHSTLYNPHKRDNHNSHKDHNDSYRIFYIQISICSRSILHPFCLTHNLSVCIHYHPDCSMTFGGSCKQPCCWLD